MAQVTVTIAGKAYRMACADGEEAHLEGLAAGFAGKVEEMRGAFGEIGDMRLHVMAALTIADELAEAKRQIADLKRQQVILEGAAGSSGQRLDEVEAELAQALGKAAERIERVARGLNAAVAAG